MYHITEVEFAFFSLFCTSSRFCVPLESISLLVVRACLGFLGKRAGIGREMKEPLKPSLFSQFQLYGTGDLLVKKTLTGQLSPAMRIISISSEFTTISLQPCETS